MMAIETKENENAQPSKGSTQVNEAGGATANASDIVKRKRGRPSGSSGGGTDSEGGKPSASQAIQARNAELQAQFDRLYSPEVWEGVVAAPANLALAFTGNKIWDLPEKEVKVLSVQASATARCFAVTDPKWLALTMLAVSVMTIYGGRAGMYFKEKSEKETAKENKPL